MLCPHCQTSFHDGATLANVGRDVEGAWGARWQTCPECKRIVIEFVCAADITYTKDGFVSSRVRRQFLAYPRVSSRPPPPNDVPKDFADDYREAALVFADSPKASAALSRRCLQHLLRERAGVKHADLAKEIDQVLANSTLPSHLADAIDAIRNIGNFAAHPIKSTASGEVTSVEPGEAEWTLDVLDGLFDFFFVQPAVLKKRRDALNAKLAVAGKPPAKQL